MNELLEVEFTLALTPRITTASSSNVSAAGLP